MNLYRPFFIMLFLVLFAPLVSASINKSNGVYIYEACSQLLNTESNNASQGDKEALRLWCLGFIKGSVDMVSLINVAVGEKMLFCIPKQVTDTERASVLVDYLQQHPDQWNANKSLLLLYAFAKKYPCG